MPARQHPSVASGSAPRPSAENRPLSPPNTEETQLITLDLSDSGGAAGSLLVMNGNAVGRMYPVQNRDLLIGRSSECDISLTENGVSRKHARLSLQPDGTIRLTDLNSTNGTFINGRRIQSATLTNGDRFQVGGSVILKYSLRDRLEEECLQQLYQNATNDPLTGIRNKRYLLERLEQECAFCSRRNLPLSVVMLDVDRFKQINDTYGHTPAGDAVLCRIAELLGGTIRAEDVFGRFGGEEFLLILSSTAGQDAAKLAERVRSLIAGSEFATVDLAGKPVRISVTISIGVATYDGNGRADAQSLLSAADRMLYKAKSAGRNRVVDDSDEDPGDGADTDVPAPSERLRLGRVLVEMGIVTAPQVLAAVQRQAAAPQSGSLADVLVAMGFCTRADVTRALGRSAGAGDQGL